MFRAEYFPSVLQKAPIARLAFGAISSVYLANEKSALIITAKYFRHSSIVFAVIRLTKGDDIDDNARNATFVQTGVDIGSIFFAIVLLYFAIGKGSAFACSLYLMFKVLLMSHLIAIIVIMFSNGDDLKVFVVAFAVIGVTFNLYEMDRTLLHISSISGAATASRSTSKKLFQCMVTHRRCMDVVNMGMVNIKMANTSVVNIQMLKLEIVNMKIIMVNNNLFQTTAMQRSCMKMVDMRIGVDNLKR